MSGIRIAGNHSFFTVGTKFEKLSDLFRLGQFSTDLFQRRRRNQIAAVINSEDLFDHIDLFRRVTGTGKTDFVDHFHTSVAAFRHHKRRDILRKRGTSGNDRKSADPAELVNSHQTGKNGVVLNFRVTAGDGTVDINHMVADFAVVGDVAGRHEKAVVSDNGFGSRFGSAVDGGAFAENVAVADFNIGSGALFHSVVLGGLTDGGEGVKHIVFAEGGVTVNVALGDQPGAGADFYIGSDIAKRTDFHTVTKDGTIHDNTGRVNFCHNVTSLFLNVIIPYFIKIFCHPYTISSKMESCNCFWLVKCKKAHYFINMTKNNNTEFKVTLVLDRLRSAHNTGNIFRIAEALGAEIAACGYTPFPPHPKLEKTAMGSDKMVRCRHFETSLDAVNTLRSEGVKMVLAAEPGGCGAWEMEYQFPLAIVLGNEALGVAEETLQCVDGIVSLPMLGEKASINVGNAAAAVMYAVAAKNGITK